MLKWLIRAVIVCLGLPALLSTSAAPSLTPQSAFESKKLYLSESEYGELDEALQEDYRRSPGPKGFLEIMEGLRLHQAALRRGQVRASFAILLLEGAASRYFVRLGESLPGPWPSGLVAPLLEDFLTNERSAYKGWGVERNIMRGGGDLRILVPDATSEWPGVTQAIGEKLPYPLLVITTPPESGEAPTHVHPLLKIRVSRYLDDYYSVRFDFDDGYEGFGYGAICRFNAGQPVEVLVMDWDL